MIPLRLLPQRATVTRSLNSVAAATACPATINISYVNSQPVLLQFSVAGISGTATFTVTGELQGVAQTETLVISSSGKKRSAKQWTKVTQVQTSSTAGAVNVAAVYSTGEQAYQFTTIHTALPCRTERVSTTRREFLTEVSGGFQLASLVVLHTNASDLEIGDRIVIDSVLFEIENPVAELDQNGYHHTEAILKRLKIT